MDHKRQRWLVGDEPASHESETQLLGAEPLQKTHIPHPPPRGAQAVSYKAIMTGKIMFSCSFFTEFTNLNENKSPPIP